MVKLLDASILCTLKQKNQIVYKVTPQRTKLEISLRKDKFICSPFADDKKINK